MNHKPTPVVVSHGQRLNIDGHLYTVMGASPVAWLRHLNTVPCDLPHTSTVTTVPTRTGDLVRIGGHRYAVLGSAPEHKLGAFGLVPESGEAEHRYCGGDCPLSSTH